MIGRQFENKKDYEVVDSEARPLSATSKFLSNRELKASGINTAQTRLVYIFKHGRSLFVTKEEALALTNKYNSIKIVKKPELKEKKIAEPKLDGATKPKEPIIKIKEKPENKIGAKK